MIKVGKALIEAIEQLEREKGIEKETIMRSICDAMIAAYKKHIKGKQISNIVAAIDEANGEIGVFRIKEIVEDEVQSEHTEILLADAKQIDPDCEVGEEIEVEVTPADFGRIAAQSAKQVITQRIREAERNLILDEFTSKIGTLVTGVVRRVEHRNVIVNIGKADAVLPKQFQVPREYYRINDRIRVCIKDVKETSKLPQIILSHVDSKIVQELFELEVPEIEDGIIEVKSISRSAGFRTKLAVASVDPNVDPVGACIGPRGSRIQTIVNELKNEKIDIVRYSDDPVDYIANAISPAKVISINILAETPEEKVAMIIVPDDQLSLAIGKEGQNVRLAHKLTGWKLDIKSLSRFEEMQQEYQEYPEEEYPQEQYEEAPVEEQSLEEAPIEEAPQEEAVEEPAEEATEEVQEQAEEEKVEEDKE